MSTSSSSSVQHLTVNLVFFSFCYGRFDTWSSSVDNHEARLFYELRGLPLPSELGFPVKGGTRSANAAAKDDGDESDDALGHGKVNFKSVELEG